MHGREDPGGQAGRQRDPEQGGRSPNLPLLPVHVGGDGDGADGIRQIHPRLLQPGPQRPGDAAQVRGVRSHLRHAGLCDEQGRDAGGLREWVYNPGVPQEPEEAIL